MKKIVQKLGRKHYKRVTKSVSLKNVNTDLFYLVLIRFKSKIFFKDLLTIN